LLHSYDYAAEVLEKLPKERYVIVDYLSSVNKPVETVTAACEWFGLEVTCDISEHAAEAQQKHKPEHEYSLAEFDSVLDINIRKDTAHVLTRYHSLQENKKVINFVYLLLHVIVVIITSVFYMCLYIYLTDFCFTASY